MSESVLNVIRANISVPKALKARMEEVAADTNWSAVACEAFEARLAAGAAAQPNRRGRPKKTDGDFRQVGFRLPVANFDVLRRYAEARGLDLSAVLNTLLADALPEMAAWLATKEEVMRKVGMEEGGRQ